MHVPHVVPAGAAPAAKPAAPVAPRPAPARPGPKPGEDAGGGLRVLTYLRLHWLMILFCGTLLGGAGAVAAWELLASKYESYAMLHVSSVPSVVASGGNREQARTDFVTEVKTTSALIKSEFVLNAALRDLRDCPTIKAQKNPIKYLEEELAVTWQDGSEVIRITFKSHEPADAKKIVDAVQKAFMNEVVEEDVKKKKRFLQRVQESQSEIREILNKKVPAALAKGPTPAAPGGAVPTGGVPPKDDAPAPKDGVPPKDGAPGLLPALPGAAPLGPAPAPAPADGGVRPTGFEIAVKLNPRILVDKVVGLHAQLESLPQSINDGRRRLDVLQKEMDAIRAAPVSKLTLDAIEKDGEVVAQVRKVEYAHYQYEIRYNVAIDKTAPGIVSLEKAWKLQQARLDQMKKDKSDTIELEKRVAAANKIADQMKELIRGLEQKQEQYAAVKASLARTERQLAELPPPGEKGGIVLAGGREPEVYRPEASDLESTDGIFRRLVTQYYQISMELNSPPRVRVLQPGSAPVQKDLKKQLLGTIFAGLLGFGLMGLGAVGFETAAKRVSTLADVKAATPLPVVGVVPSDPADPTGNKNPGRRAAATEAVDKLRAYVAQTWLARGASTVAVTSPLGEEGKGLTAFGLASSLAQSGYRTLLVDFDLRSPSLHEFAGATNQNGVCELLRAELDARAAVQFLPSGLHLVPAGKWSDEARKAATGEKLEALLAKLKGPYDCVVLHGHALLAAAEAIEVARRCEVVLVCAKYRETTTPLLKRAAERVAAMEIPHSGVVYVGASENEALC